MEHTIRGDRGRRRRPRSGSLSATASTLAISSWCSIAVGAQREPAFFISRSDAVMISAKPLSPMAAIGGARLNSRWRATVCASVYLRMPAAAVTTTQTRVAHAAHRRIDAAPCRGVRLVDVHRSRAEPSGHSVAPLSGATPDAGVQPVAGVVGQLDRLVVGRERSRATRPGRRSPRGSTPSRPSRLRAPSARRRTAPGRADGGHPPSTVAPVRQRRRRRAPARRRAGRPR